ncbi:S1 family peptidase [Arthrobacter sp. D1-17]
MRFHDYAPGARRGPRRHAPLGIAAVLAFGIAAASAPAHATGESPTPAVTIEAANGQAVARKAATAPAPGDEGLAEAVARDLGMTLAEFNAAGAQAKRAAEALAVLRDLRGFVAVRLRDGHIRVEGSGPELEDRVAGLNRAGGTGRDEFVLTGSAPDQAAGRPAETSANPVASEPAAGTAAGGELQVSSVEQLYRAYLREVGPVGLQAVAEAGGKFIIRTGGVNSAETARKTESQGGSRASEAAGAAGTSPSDFVKKYANVVLVQGEPLASEEDFFGGQGYRVDGSGVVCSAGFSAFSPAGEPLVLTAGHCADDGAARRTEVTLPAGDPAGGAVAGSAVTGELGIFGFSQFGGPGNAWIGGDLDNPGDPGKDIAVVESIRGDLNLLPAATTWEDTADLGKNSVQIVGSAAPVVGQFVCRSGRTEGWSCGVVDEVGIYVVGGPSGEPADLRSFRGFLSYSVQSAGGDSGGPWISGNYAVGTHSAGNPRSSLENYAVAATLQDSLQVLPGVELRLFLSKPVLTTPLSAGPIAEGQRISGRIPSLAGTSVPAGSSVRITLPGREPLVVPADAAGMWSFAAPASTPGFSAQAVNGFSSSAVSTFRSRTEPAAPAPAPPGPIQGSGASGEDTPARPEPVRPVAPAVLTPAPEPTVAAVQPQGVQPQGQAGSWTGPTAAAAALADTGASGLPAAGGAAVALIVGGLLLIALRRRGRR